MFRKNNDENSDEYNESYSEKYNKEDTEYHEYDHFTDAERVFGHLLKKGEKILWSDQKNSSVKESGSDKRRYKIGKTLCIAGGISAIVGLAIPHPVFYVLMFVGIAVLCVGILFRFKYLPAIRDYYYAFTEKRIIMLNGSKVYSIYYVNIVSTNLKLSGGNNFGSVNFEAIKFLFNDENVYEGRYPLDIEDIKDPAKVKDMLDELIRKEKEPIKQGKAE